jgi:hypothetical protein
MAELKTNLYIKRLSDGHVPILKKLVTASVKHLTATSAKQS